LNKYEKSSISDEEKKKYFLDDVVRRRAEELSPVYVIYSCPRCPGVEHDVLLDRYPMSEKIHAMCKHCNKYTLLEIFKPILFYCPWNKKTLEQKDLKDMYIDPTNRQAVFISLYAEEVDNG